MIITILSIIMRFAKNAFYVSTSGRNTMIIRTYPRFFFFFKKNTFYKIYFHFSNPVSRVIVQYNMYYWADTGIVENVLTLAPLISRTRSQPNTISTCTRLIRNNNNKTTSRWVTFWFMFIRIFRCGSAAFKPLSGGYRAPDGRCKWKIIAGSHDVEYYIGLLLLLYVYKPIASTNNILLMNEWNVFYELRTFHWHTRAL